MPPPDLFENTIDSLLAEKVMGYTWDYVFNDDKIIVGVRIFNPSTLAFEAWMPHSSLRDAMQVLDTIRSQQVKVTIVGDETYDGSYWMVSIAVHPAFPNKVVSGYSAVEGEAFRLGASPSLPMAICAAAEQYVKATWRIP